MTSKNVSVPPASLVAERPQNFSHETINRACDIAARVLRECAHAGVQIKIYWRKSEVHFAFQGPTRGETRELLFRIGAQPNGHRTWVLFLSELEKE